MHSMEAEALANLCHSDSAQLTGEFFAHFQEASWKQSAYQNQRVLKATN
jgi:hypothetical protein